MRLKDRIALITGASRGIGAAIAKRYAAEGAHVICVARTTGGLEELDDEIKALGGSTTLIPLDLAKTEMIDGLAAPLLERFGRIDILVGNAGIFGRMTPLHQFPPNLWEEVFKVNVHANQRLIRAVHPLLFASTAGRAIFVTSTVSREIRAYWGAYAASKAALDNMVMGYAKEVAQSNIRVNLVNPGGTRSKMRAEAFPGEDPSTLPKPEDITEVFVALAEASSTRNGEWINARDFCGIKA
ncbi:SDR family NAD(P)-dependent oxidoreductase [Ferrovibrio sp.]|uniref:SDR family NAD(P)-dependent oxidoreductase n=1 Tax=Ferrovibrio sp. TaxID=1917215 RepID=UPI000CB0F805|nr:SDR family NAD(P)-dependent oxidoreductase [Ferrovibrio sp.]PJI41001.1 MAG: oxidoreductase [Ferrovibrio sp.]